MKRLLLVPALVFLTLATSVPAALVNFSYTQDDSTTGFGTIAPFTFDGHDFTATALPSATVVNPVPTSTPAGFVGAQNVAVGNANEANSAVGLIWGGTVTATATDGSTIQIPLVFVAKETQVPDVNDYSWNIIFGDSATQDAASTSMRFGVWLSRDDVVDAAETPNTFQRYTQINHTFLAGALDTFSNNQSTTTAIKDATDAGAPAGSDAAGRNLAFYFGWRDQGALSSGAILVDTFTVGGLLNADASTMVVVPEPSTLALLGLGGVAALAFLRRKK